MNSARARYAISPQAFGRGPARVLAMEQPASGPLLGDDVKLFASTFAAGFLFVTLFLA